MVNILKKDDHSAYGIRHFVADEEKDIPTIDTKSLSPGSTVFVIDNSKTYMLNSSKLWVKVSINNGGGDTGPVYDGGGVSPDTNPPGNNNSHDGGHVI